MSATVERTHGTRLPSPAELPSRGRQLLVGTLALLGTVVVVVGVPLALLAAFGTPWPDEAPSSDWLTRPTTTDTVLGVLAAVVWLAWLHFVVCLLVEAFAERRDRGLPPHVPGGGIGTQALARRAIAAIAMLAGTTAATIGPVAAAQAPSAPSVVAVQSTTAATPSTTSGAVGPDAIGPLSTGLPRAAELLDASARDLAEGVTTYYEVRPPEGRHYDTMWDIAERYLGSGTRYKEVYDLNRGLLQGDGRALRDADLIQPGWVLRLPNDARGPGLKVVAHADVPSTPSGAVAGSSGSSTSSTSATGTVTPTGTPAAAASADDGGPSIDGDWAPLFGVGGGLALAGAFLALRRQRASMSTRQLWTLRTGAAGPDPLDPEPDPDGPPPGASLRNEADPGTAGWLDRALRSWGPGQAGLAPARVSVGSGGLAVAFDESVAAEPPRGWRRHGDTAWVLDRADDHRPDPDDPAGAAPLPGLVCVGQRSDGTLLLVDPESQRGVVALEGAEQVARGLAMSMVVDTATHPWADRRTVTLVGFADDLGPLAHVHRTADVGRALESIDNLARYQRDACRRAGVATAREGRAAAPDAADWSYHLLVCSGVPAEEPLRRLQALAAHPAVALGVVVVGAVPGAAMVLSAHADGRLTAPLHGIDVRAQVLGAAATRALTALQQPPADTRRVSLDQLAETLVAEGPVAGAAEAHVSVRVLGPVDVTAPGPVDPERRAFLTELACLLALHPRGVHVNRIAAALWPRGVEPTVRDSALQQLTAWLGQTREGLPVVTSSAGVWSLTPGAVDLDWDRFRGALNDAADHPATRDAQLRAALAMVRGEPFGDVPPGRYGWLAQTTVEDDIALAVALTTQALAESAVAHDDADTARGTLRRGLGLMPANEELWRALLRLEAQVSDRDTLRSVADEAYAAIERFGSPLGASAQTDALVDELLPGHRSRVA